MLMQLVDTYILKLREYELINTHIFIYRRKRSSLLVMKYMVSIKPVKEPECHQYHRQYRYRSRYCTFVCLIGLLEFVLWMMSVSLSIYPSLCYIEDVRSCLRVRSEIDAKCVFLRLSQ